LYCAISGVVVPLLVEEEPSFLGLAMVVLADWASMGKITQKPRIGSFSRRQRRLKLPLSATKVADT
jgi:hypothetical protein